MRTRCCWPFGVAMLSIVGCAPVQSAGEPTAPTTAPIVEVNEVTAERAQNAEAPAEDAEPGGGWLGVALEITERDAPGVRVTSVVRGSPAALAGVKVDDVILRIDNQPTEHPRDVVRIISSHSVGSRAALMLRRADEDRLVKVALAARPDDEGILRLSYVGRPAPELAGLSTVQGNLSPTLQSMRGSVVVLEFWATWCVACRVMLPTLNDWHERYNARGLNVVGVAAEPVTLTSRYANELQMAFAVFSDEEGQTTQAYHALALPTVFIIDQSGMVVDVMVGYHPGRLGEVQSLVEQLLHAG